MRPALTRVGTIATLLAAAALVGAAPAAHAATGLGAGALDGIVGSFNQIRAFEPVLMNQAKLLFAGLALIELVLAIGRQVIGRADLGGILASVLFQVLTLGFFYWLCINGPDMSRAITGSFAQVANDASTAAGGSANVSPGDVFNAGLDLVKAIWGGMSATTPGKDLLLAIAGCLVLGIFATIAGMLVEVIVESYFVASAGVILLGFGGSSNTRNLAVAQFHLAISVGMKRLVLQLLVGLSQTMIQGWANTPAANLDWQAIAIMVGVPLVLLRLVTTLPQRAQDMILGSHANMGRGLGAVPATAAALAGGAAVGAVGGAAATAAAFREASATIAARETAGTGGSISESSGVGASLGRAARVSGMAAASLGRAAANDIGQRMTGNYAAQHGYASWRMAGAMNATAANLRGAMANGNQAPMANGTTQSPGNQIGAGQP